jgi:hypothetical protein
MTAIAAVGDLNGDGHPDLVGRDSTGSVWLYPNTGSATLGSRSLLASAWGTNTWIG